MKKALMIISLVALVALVAWPVWATTLYEQEGDAILDGTPSIDASGQGPVDANWANWKYQYGGGTWSGIYGTEGWEEEISTGDSNLEVEADIEMYYTEEISNNKIYFHLGNIFAATAADLTAYVQGTFSSNNGQWIGICFTGTDKDESSFEKVGGAYTGVILDGMKWNRDLFGRTSPTYGDDMDVRIRLTWGAGWRTPGIYGDGASNTIHDTLWWLVNDGVPGTYNFQWEIRLLPQTAQADGDYSLDPVLTSTPVL